MSHGGILLENGHYLAKFAIFANIPHPSTPKEKLVSSTENRWAGLGIGIANKNNIVRFDLPFIYSVNIFKHLLWIEDFYTCSNEISVSGFHV